MQITNKCDSKLEVCFGMGRKHFGQKKKIFPKSFQKPISSTAIEISDLCYKRVNGLLYRNIKQLEVFEESLY